MKTAKTILIAWGLTLLVALAFAQTPTSPPNYPVLTPQQGDSDTTTMQKQLMAMSRANAVDIDATKSNTVDLPHQVTAIWCGVTGTIKVDMATSGTVTLTGVPAGFWLDGINVKRVYVTGTTATALIGFY